MTLRKVLSQGLAKPPTEAASLRDTMMQALELPPLVPIRLFWDSLAAMRPWWPVLLPLLAWIGWRTYRDERARVLARHR
jgi:hypothetical protein